MKQITSEWTEKRFQQDGRHVFVPYYTNSMWNADGSAFMFISADADLKHPHVHVYSVDEQRIIKDFPLTLQHGGSMGVSLETAAAWWERNMLIVPDGPNLVGISMEDGCQTVLWEAPDESMGTLSCGTLSPDGKQLAYGAYGKNHTELLIFGLPDFHVQYRHDFGTFLANHFQFMADSRSLLFAHEGKTEGIDDRVNRLDPDTDTCTCLHCHYRDLETGEQLECIGHEMAAAGADFVCAVRYPVSRLPGAVVAMDTHGGIYREIDQDDFWHVSCNSSGTILLADTMWWGHTRRKETGIIDILRIDVPHQTKEVVKTIRQFGNGQHQHPHPYSDASGRQILFMECNDRTRELASLTLRTMVADS